MKLFFGKSVGLLKPYLYFIWSVVAYYYICAGGMNFDIFPPDTEPAMLPLAV